MKIFLVSPYVIKDLRVISRAEAFTEKIADLCSLFGRILAKAACFDESSGF